MGNINQFKLERVSPEFWQFWRWFECPKWKLCGADWSLQLDPKMGNFFLRPPTHGKPVTVVETASKVAFLKQWHINANTKARKSPIILEIKEGYVWDVTGSILTRWGTGEKEARAAMPHDAFYSAVEGGVLAPNAKGNVDLLFRKHLIQAGCSEKRTNFLHAMVVLFGCPRPRPGP